MDNKELQLIDISRKNKKNEEIQLIDINREKKKKYASTRRSASKKKKTRVHGKVIVGAAAVVALVNYGNIKEFIENTWVSNFGFIPTTLDNSIDYSEQGDDLIQVDYNMSYTSNQVLSLLSGNGESANLNDLCVAICSAEAYFGDNFQYKMGDDNYSVVHHEISVESVFPDKDKEIVLAKDRFAEELMSRAGFSSIDTYDEARAYLAKNLLDLGVDEKDIDTHIFKLIKMQNELLEYNKVLMGENNNVR